MIPVPGLGAVSRVVIPAQVADETSTSCSYSYILSCNVSSCTAGAITSLPASRAPRREP